MGRGDKGLSKIKSSNQFADSSAFNPYNRPAPIKFFNLGRNFGPCKENIIHSPSDCIHHSLQIIFYAYFMLMLLTIMLSLISSHKFITNAVYPSLPYVNTTFKLSLLCLMHIKIGYFCIISSVLLKYICLGNVISKQARKSYIGSSKFCRILAHLLLCLLLLNFLLIGIVNPSILNPGPNPLRVCYQNVQGLIPFSQLDKSQPSLDKTKIFELNAFININKPDILILNETCLKNLYKIVRLF